MRKTLTRYNPKIVGPPGLPLDGSFEVLYTEYDVPANALEEGVDMLYKYRALGDLSVRNDGTTATQDVVSILKSSRLYAASPVEMNDPFELRIRPPGKMDRKSYMEYVSGWIKVLGSDYSNPELAREFRKAAESLDEEGHDMVLRAIFSTVAEEFRYYRIVSLTERNNDPLMWGYYAGGNSGVCLGFRVSKDKFFREALKVVYHDTPPQFKLEDYLSGKMMEGATLGKAARWSHEKEWRLVVLNLRNPPATTKFLEYDPSCLEEIIFGLRVDKKAEDAIRTAAAHNSNVRFGRIREAEDRDEFSIAWDDPHPAEQATSSAISKESK